MQVILRANWFVEGRRIRCGVPPSRPVEVPDHLREKLPTGARVAEDGTTASAPKVIDEAKTFSAMARGLSGRKSMVDFLNSNPPPPAQPEPVPEPKPLPEPEPEAEEPEDVAELLKAAKAASGKGRKKK